MQAAFSVCICIDISISIRFWIFRVELRVTRAILLLCCFYFPHHSPTFARSDVSIYWDCI